ncbi:8666_t:CDS:2 [Paraglomus brasilianum]|uniref:8666_t:CDS:1 n=1 Tax=Paraglomus brasilianum TaxID=144538 RepID=A0A9N9BH65_9GLOM|nr:8666_t:CDS:2 [Paraglomus brasilianum]
MVGYFKFKRKHGEGAFADHAAAVAVTELLKDYNLKDIYNMNETILFYRYASTTRLKEKKKDKTTDIGAMFGNADGSDKMKPLVIVWMTELLFQSWISHTEEDGCKNTSTIQKRMRQRKYQLIKK